MIVQKAKTKEESINSTGATRKKRSLKMEDKMVMVIIVVIATVAATGMSVARVAAAEMIAAAADASVMAAVAVIAVSAVVVANAVNVVATTRRTRTAGAVEVQHLRSVARFRLRSNRVISSVATLMFDTDSTRLGEKYAADVW